MAKEREKGQEQERKGSGAERGVARREGTSPQAAMPLGSPFGLVGQLMQDMDRLLEGFGFGPSMPRIDVAGRETPGIPPLEILERNGQLVIRADVPGLSKDQINVEIENGHLVISGERCQEHEEQQGNVYRSERSYGSFYRVVPLPDGVDPEQAKATFANGVLEITLPLPQRAQAKPIEIQDGPQQAQSGTGTEQRKEAQAAAGTGQQAQAKSA